VINVQDLSFLYGQKKALDRLSFELTAGFNVLLGPNGAGKSTLISLLTSLYRPSSGEILINGHPLNSGLAGATANAMKVFGVVFQQSTLDLDLSVKQNLVYHGALHGISAKKTLANATQMLEKLELSDRLNDKVRALNGGHRRRVEIVRALIHQPKILLLDEASVGLDPASRSLLISHIRAIALSDKVCVLWATHLFDEINDDDQVLILNQGQLQISGQVAALCHQHQVTNLSQLFNQLAASGVNDAF